VREDRYLIVSKDSFVKNIEAFFRCISSCEQTFGTRRKDEIFRVTLFGLNKFELEVQVIIIKEGGSGRAVRLHGSCDFRVYY
jgi:dissimilatory sulfite reductase (desulfoviridin) alpha/beta subunit